MHRTGSKQDSVQHATMGMGKATRCAYVPIWGTWIPGGRHPPTCTSCGCEEHPCSVLFASSTSIFLLSRCERLRAGKQKSASRHRLDSNNPSLLRSTQ